MGSWACELIVSVLAQQPTPPPAQLPANQFFYQWALFGGAIAGIVGLAPAVRWFFTYRHRDLQSAVLSLEQVASAAFVRIVLTEARRVFAIVDDHLPLSLSQMTSTSSQLSRFDHFCKALREIPAEELDDRGKYANIIKESFGGIISASAGRLLDTMGSGDIAAEGAVLNPTRIRFSLEGDSFLSFASVSQFDSHNRRIEAWFRRLWATAGIFIVPPILAAAIVLVMTLINKEWAETIGWLAIWSGLGSVIACAAFFVASWAVKQSIVLRSRRYGDPSAVEEFVRQQKRRYERTDH